MDEHSNIKFGILRDKKNTIASPQCKSCSNLCLISVSSLLCFVFLFNIDVALLSFPQSLFFCLSAFVLCYSMESVCILWQVLPQSSGSISGSRHYEHGILEAHSLAIMSIAVSADAHMFALSSWPFMQISFNRTREWVCFHCLSCSHSLICSHLKISTCDVIPATG